MKPHTKMTIDALVVESPPPVLGLEVSLAGTEVGLEEDEDVAGIDGEGRAGWTVGATGSPTPCGTPGGLAGCVVATATSVRNTAKRIAHAISAVTFPLFRPLLQVTFFSTVPNFRCVPWTWTRNVASLEKCTAVLSVDG